MGASSRAARFQPGELVRLGVIAGAHGLRGGLKFKPDNPASPSLSSLRRVVIDRGGQLESYRLVVAAEVSRHHMRLMLEEIVTAEQAEALRGATLYALIADLPATAPGEFYYFEALGCEVVTTAGRRLGKIEEVFSNGASDIWVVRDGAAEYLIPVIADVVRATDFGARRVTIEAIPGLLD